MDCKSTIFQFKSGYHLWGCGGMVDTLDLKSNDFKLVVRVQIPLSLIFELLELKINNFIILIFSPNVDICFSMCFSIVI